MVGDEREISKGLFGPQRTFTLTYSTEESWSKVALFVRPPPSAFRCVMYRDGTLRGVSTRVPDGEGTPRGLLGIRRTLVSGQDRGTSGVERETVSPEKKKWLT